MTYIILWIFDSYSFTILMYLDRTYGWLHYIFYWFPSPGIKNPRTQPFLMELSNFCEMIILLKVILWIIIGVILVV